jgi:hypothetical protein
MCSLWSSIRSSMNNDVPHAFLSEWSESTGFMKIFEQVLLLIICCCQIALLVMHHAGYFNLLQEQESWLVPAPTATPLFVGQFVQLLTVPPSLHWSCGQFWHPLVWSRYCPLLQGSSEVCFRDDKKELHAFLSSGLMFKHSLTKTLTLGFLNLLQAQEASLVPAPSATSLFGGHFVQLLTVPPSLHWSCGQFWHPLVWSRYCPLLQGSGYI